MKTFIACTCVLLVAAAAPAQGVYNMAKQQAKNVSNKVSSESGVEPGSPPPQSQPPAAPQPSAPQLSPANPALEATLQNIAGLRADFVAIGKAVDTNSAAAQKMSLLNDLSAAAQGTKPSQKAISKLGDDLTATIAGKEKFHAPQQKLAVDVHAIFNGSHLTEAQQKMISDDAQKILAACGASPDDITNVINDLKTIVTETK